MSGLLDFLFRRKTNEGENATMVSLPPSPGKWTVPKEDYREFLRLYSVAISNGANLHMTEIHRGSSPILIDLDFHINNTCGVTRQYNNEDIVKIVELYNQQIRSYLDIEEEKLEAYIFEKSKPLKDDKGYYKDGIHIIYPHIITKPDVQYEIRANVVEAAKESNIFHHMKLLNDYGNVFDESVIKKSGWFLYGSSKEGKEYYKLTQKIDYQYNVDNNPEYNINDLVELLSIRNHEKEDIYESKIEISHRSSHSLPMNNNIRDRNVYTDEMTNEDVKELVKLLGKERSDSRANWIEVGFCLYNIDLSLCNLWIEFSKKSEKFKYGECEKKWRTFGEFRGIKLGVGSLHFWANKDSPEDYAKMQSNSFRQIIKNSLSDAHHDIATLVLRKYQYQFVCVDPKKQIFFEFENHKWNECKGQGHKLRNRVLSDELVKEFKKMGAIFKSQSIENPDNTEYVKNYKKCDKIMKDLKTRSFKEAVMKEVADQLYDASFFEKLDSKVNLIGFLNGVYDLEHGVFREGWPEDYISFSTHCNYYPFDKNDIRNRNMLECFATILPDKGVREYVLRLAASALSGETGDQKFHIWTGGGANGKSTISNLLEEGLGDYSGKFPVTVITRKRGAASSCTPELAATKGKRLMNLAEPDETDKIQVGIMKELTGGDTIMCRPLYGPPVEFKPQFKLLLCCNKLPEVTATDFGTWRRIEVVKFESSFVDEPDPNNPLEYKRNNDIQKNLNTWIEPFMSLIIEIYKKYKVDGLSPPESITEHTNNYKLMNNFYRDFYLECIERTNNPRDIILVADVEGEFKEWYRETYSKNPPPRKEYKVRLEEIMQVKQNKGQYHGFLIRTIEVAREDL